MRVLVTEDDPVSAMVLEATLAKSGYQVDVARTGTEALSLLVAGAYDVHIVDWMLPGCDGIEVIRQTRSRGTPPPVVVMLTALAFPEARQHALSSGADEFLAKPVSPHDVTAAVLRGLNRVRQRELAPATLAIPEAPAPRRPGAAAAPPFVGVAIAASTGGPDAVRAFFQADLPASAAYFVVIHGPDWMQESVAGALAKVTALEVSVAEAGMPVRGGHVYLARGDRHLTVSNGLELRLWDGPPENFVRPSADPLFRSVARAFGESSVGVVLTGVGCDGAAGASEIAAAGGRVVVQDPLTCAAGSMPRAAQRAVGARCATVPLEALGRAVADAVRDGRTRFATRGR